MGGAPENDSKELSTGVTEPQPNIAPNGPLSGEAKKEMASQTASPSTMSLPAMEQQKILDHIGNLSEPEKTAIRNELTEWRQYCRAWANAYHSAAESAQSWNSRLIVIAIFGAALLTAMGGSTIVGGTAPTLLGIPLGLLAAAVGVVTATVNGLQKTTLANPEQAKQYHSSAVAYDSAARDIDSTLTSGPEVDVKVLKDQRDKVQTQLNATDAQAQELPKKYRNQATQAIQEPQQP